MTLLRRDIEDMCHPQDSKLSRDELNRMIEDYKKNGGKVSVAADNSSITITRAEILKEFNVTDEWLSLQIKQKKFPFAVNMTYGSYKNRSNKSRDTYLYREVKKFFENKMWEHQVFSKESTVNYRRFR